MSKDELPGLQETIDLIKQGSDRHDLEPDVVTAILFAWFAEQRWQRIERLAGVVGGQILLASQYLDRMLKKRAV